MADETRLKNIGLRGVPVADSKISHIDGAKGILIYRGYRIEDLAARCGFEEVLYLLLNGHLPTAAELSVFAGELRESRSLPDFISNTMKTWPRTATTMDVLQASLPLLAMADADHGEESRAANERKAARVVSRMAVVVAAWHRIRNGLEPLPLDPRLSHAGNFLWQFNGRPPSEGMARDLEVAMILQAEHTFNASTFACRQVASTGAHLYASVAAGVGALSGRLHGGANAQVVEMLCALEEARLDEGEIAAWVRSKLDRREKIMGMGHAVYKTLDPRSTILKQIVHRLALETGQEKRFRLLARIEEECHRELEKRGKPMIKSNVDFYSGLLYALMGIPMDAMTAVFAMSLVAGWCAHILEEKFADAQPQPVPYQPSADYVGVSCGAAGCGYQPIEQR